MDDSPLLPSQFQDASSEPKKPTPCWKRIVMMNLLYFAYFLNITMFVPYFEGESCPDLQPIALIISVLMFSAGSIAAVLVMVHNCKLKTFTDPQVIDYAKLKDGEMYKGHKAVVIANLVAGPAQLVFGVWAFVYALMHRDLMGVEGCFQYLLFLMLMGGIVTAMLVLLIVGGIVSAIKSKGKANK
jgi:hypothetical protein